MIKTDKMKKNIIVFSAVVLTLLLSSFVYLENCVCDICRGEGWITETRDCTSCGGLGEITCIRCNGKGTELCTFCFGDGTLLVKCSTCGGSGSVNDEKCQTCNGEGKVRESCTNCNGKGRFQCGRCNGVGKEVCTMCSGTGKKDWKFPCEKCGRTGIIPCP